MSNRLMRMLPILLGIGLMAGCGSRELIVLLPSEEGKTGRLAVSNEDGNTVVLDSPLAAAEVDGSGTASAVSLSTLSLRNAFGAMPSAMPKAPISYVVYFKFSTVALTDESQRELHTALADLRERAGAEVEVIGHTDSVGADEDNDRLSLERARAVAVMLRANAVDGSLISVSGRVESWRGNPLGCPLSVSGVSPFVPGLGTAVAPFPAPATSHTACGFTALRVPAHFASRVMRPISLEWL